MDRLLNLAYKGIDAHGFFAGVNDHETSDRHDRGARPGDRTYVLAQSSWRRQVAEKKHRRGRSRVRGPSGQAVAVRQRPYPWRPGRQASPLRWQAGDEV